MKLISFVYKVMYSGKRYAILQGGTGAGKTFAVMQYLLAYANNHQGCVISVAGESMPVLRRGPMRDLKRILDSVKGSETVKENKTLCTFTIGKSVIEFFSVHDASRLRGARRHILFINECNRVNFEVFQQLDVRTRRQTILDFNPVRRFWVHDNLIPYLMEKEYDFLKCTYKNNPFLSYEQIRNIERNKHLANWWKIYGEGEVGEEEGLVFHQWTITGKVETEVKIKAETGSKTQSELQPGNLLGYGIDFGFTHSPTAIVQVNEFNGELYVHELLYSTGIQNEELFAFVQKHLDMRALAVADSSEPKTIDYLYRKGWLGLKAAIKGEDSVEFGINLLLERKLNITPTSLNLIKELRHYAWDTNRDGAIIHRPIKEFDHAIDALRYLYSYPKKRKMVFA